MALSNLLDFISKRDNAKKEISKREIEANLADYQRLISYWRVYPDKFIDYLCSLNPNNKFKFYLVQRLYLRVACRYRNMYAVFSRGFSKSFLAVLSLMIKAVLYPGATLIVVAEGKGQSSSILASKMEEICTLIPALAMEIEWDTKGKIVRTSQSKDEVSFRFKCGSVIKNVAMTANSRGFRAQGVLTEEVATITDQAKYEEIVAPMLVISRKVNGQIDPEEVLNQNAMYVTSAGYKNTYAYDKLIDCLCRMVADKTGYDSFIFGGDWKIPVVEGLQPANFIQQQEAGAAMDASGFEREYGSIWSGTIEGAFFDMNKFDKHRIINLASYGYDNNISKRRDGGYYVMGVDVGRLNCPTEIVILKVQPPTGATINGSRKILGNVDVKQVVNIITLDAEHFQMQAIEIKRIFHRYQCDMCVIDGNGIGAGLVDILIVDHFDPDTDEPLYNMGIANLDDMNEETRKMYKSFETPDTIRNSLWVMKANATINTELYSYCGNQLRDGKLKFLIDSNTAKNRLLTQAQGKKMTPAQRAEYLKPYVETDILKDQMANLVQENEGANIILKQSNRKIMKDKFSALIYALSWCKKKEESRNKKGTRNLAKMVLFSKH